MPAAAMPPDRPCVRAEAAIAAGAVPVRADFAAAPCAGAARPALRYDPWIGAARAMRDIAAGEIIAAPPAALLADVRPGDTLNLVAHVGTATVEREVIATQAGRNGQAIFVRTADGRVVSARLPEAGR
jgi:flagella basal body P-ring formation protein FlgA